MEQQNIIEQLDAKTIEFVVEQLEKQSKSKKVVVAELVDRGFSEEDAQKAVDSVSEEIKRLRRRKHVARTIEGAVFLAIGLIATALSSDKIFIGAIVVGGIFFVVGFFGLIIDLLDN